MNPLSPLVALSEEAKVNKNSFLDVLKKASVAPGPYGAGYGITLRQHFAGLAMQGLRANSHDDCPHNSAAVAELAVADADALLAELAKEPA